MMATLAIFVLPFIPLLLVADWVAGLIPGVEGLETLMDWVSEIISFMPGALQSMLRSFNESLDLGLVIPEKMPDGSWVVPE
ncbi:MAG: hypothetical protein FWG82_02065 [Oscillospiraceae bacterium]|nr:hypothetical protein [Oscillospiraceae bacterium]